jgi:hypothetical protein
MTSCGCGCQRKVKFGRRYLNTRGVELQVVSGFGFLVEQLLPLRPIPNTPADELERVRQHIKGIAVMCLGYSGVLHDYSVGLTTGASGSHVLNNRQQVSNDEIALIDLICYCAAFCLLNGSLSSDDFLAEIKKLSLSQRTKAQKSMNLVRQMASGEERKLLPQF